MRGADTVRLNGTSVAAPQITRRIADWYASSRASTQPLPPDTIRERLTDEARRYPNPPSSGETAREGRGRVLRLEDDVH